MLNFPKCEIKFNDRGGDKRASQPHIFFFFLAELLSDTLAVVMDRKGPCYQNRQGALTAFVGTWVLHLDLCSPFSLRKWTLKRDFI